MRNGYYYCMAINIIHLKCGESNPVQTSDLWITVEWFERRRERGAVGEFCAAFYEIFQNASGGSDFFSEEGHTPCLQYAAAQLDSLAQTWDTDFPTIKKAWRPVTPFQRTLGVSFTPLIPSSC